MKVLVQKEGYRIVELQDISFEIDNLKGDMFCPDCSHDIDKEDLKEQERQFEQDIEDYGVYGYELEKWDAEVDKGWQHVDSCWGFVKPYSMEQHYIVDEMEITIGTTNL